MNSIAAEKYRIHEARQIVCQLKIVEQDIDNKPKPTAIRVFYKTDGKSGYKPTQLILKQPDEYEALFRALPKRTSVSEAEIPEYFRIRRSLGTD